MIYSMTAFARYEHKTTFGALVGELRSINHRYLEIHMHLPENLRVFEMPIRERIRDRLRRGKIEFSLRSIFQGDFSQFELNTILAKNLSHAAETISSFLQKPAAIDPANILRFSGVLAMKEADTSAIEEELFILVDKILTDLLSAREREGEQLLQLFLKRLELMGSELEKVRQRLPHVRQEQRERLLKRFEDVKLALDPSRLEQEILLFMQKIDIAEEIDRIETHLTEVRRMLKHGGVVGRRFDFLLQELNREVNTLGSKSVDADITLAAVEMKVLIEQIREQAQNVE